MPTLALTWEHAGDLSGPPLMNVHDFGENFSPSTCMRRRSTKIPERRKPRGSTGSKSRYCVQFPLSIFHFLGFLFNLYRFRRLWRGVHVFCFCFTFTKLRAFPLCVNLCSQIKSLAQGQFASSCWGHHFPFHYGVQIVTSRSKVRVCPQSFGTGCLLLSLLLYTL